MEKHHVYVDITAQRVLTFLSTSVCFITTVIQSGKE